MSFPYDEECEWIAKKVGFSVIRVEPIYAKKYVGGSFGIEKSKNISELLYFFRCLYLSFIIITSVTDGVPIAERIRRASKI